VAAVGAMQSTRRSAKHRSRRSASLTGMKLGPAIDPLAAGSRSNRAMRASTARARAASCTTARGAGMMLTRESSSVTFLTPTALAGGLLPYVVTPRSVHW
jgi:hypothetical protein